MLADRLTPLTDAASPDALHRGLDKALAALEVDCWTYYALSPGSEPAYLTRYPQAWVARYAADRLDRADPVVRATAAAVSPFQWSGLALRDSAEAAVLAEARAHGLADGWSFPVPSRGGVASLAVAFDAAPAAVARWAGQYEAAAGLVATYAHDRARQLLPGAGPPAARLTPREAEIVKWLAHGKTSWEIGVILAVAEATVNQHIRNAIDKLGVANRTQLVARALSLGLIPAL